MSMNYIGHLAIFSRQLLDNIGGFRCGFEGAEEYDLVLRASERARKIARIPKVLYHRRDVTASAKAPEGQKLAANDGGIRALEEALARRGKSGSVEPLLTETYRVRYRLAGNPLVSIIVPTKNKFRLLRRCLESIEQRSTYGNYEIIVVDNGSTQPAARKYLDSIRKKPNHKVLSFDQPFNYSRLNNFAAEHARGQFLLFLNNDTEVITPDWLEEMIGHAQYAEVGAVGAKLIYADGRVQHGGIILGIGDIAAHAFYGVKSSELGYMGLAQVVRNCSAVTAACMMIHRSLFEEVGGFDESLAVVFNDIDLCLRLREKGHVNVYSPHAVLYHYEGSTRGRNQPENDTHIFVGKWSSLLTSCDPFYNPNLSKALGDFEVNGWAHDSAK
jgi:GT2 family glycosyltransferase